MYEKFTDDARRVMQLAHRESRRFNHEYIGTEHVLLGLIQVPGVATDVLHNLGIELHRIRLEVEKLIQPGPEMVTVAKLPLTPAAKRVIEHALEEWRKLKHKQVDTEHILLGMMGDNENVAAQILMNLGLREGVARKEVEKILHQSGSSVSASQAQPAAKSDAALRPPQSCPKCGREHVFRIIWGTYFLSDKDLEMIKSKQAFLGSIPPFRNGPTWVCLECAPKWAEVHKLAMQDYEKQLEKETAIESLDFDKAARCLSVQNELRSKLAILYAILMPDK